METVPSIDRFLPAIINPSPTPAPTPPKSSPTQTPIAVIDDGTGVAPENQQKIFGVFQTLVGRYDMKGTGIGLAVIKKIVEGVGGMIAVKSAIGQGNTFSFSWPKMS